MNCQRGSGMSKTAPEFPIIEDLPVELDDVADMEVEARIEEALQQAEAESDVAPNESNQILCVLQRRR